MPDDRIFLKRLCCVLFATRDFSPARQMKRERWTLPFNFLSWLGVQFSLGQKLDEYAFSVGSGTGSCRASSAYGSSSVAFSAFEESAIANYCCSGFLNFNFGNGLPKPHAETLSFFF